MRVLGKLSLCRHKRIALFITVFQITSDLPGRGIRRDELRELLLQVSQFIHEMVILIVTYDRSIVHIVFSAVLPEYLPQLYDSFFCL